MSCGGLRWPRWSYGWLDSSCASEKRSPSRPGAAGITGNRRTQTGPSPHSRPGGGPSHAGARYSRRSERHSRVLAPLRTSRSGHCRGTACLGPAVTGSAGEPADETREEQMSAGIITVIIVAASIVVVAIVAGVGYNGRRRRLRRRFGPEYDSLVEERGSRRKAEAELAER